MNRALHSRASRRPRPSRFGNAGQSAWSWPTWLALASFVVAAVVIFDVPSPLRPLAVLAFLGFGPGLSVIGLFGISDLTQRLVLSIAVSLALDTIVAGLSLYAGLWSPVGVLLILIAITLVGAGLQLSGASLKLQPVSGSRRSQRSHPMRATTWDGARIRTQSPPDRLSGQSQFGLRDRPPRRLGSHHRSRTHDTRRRNR